MNTAKTFFLRAQFEYLFRGWGARKTLRRKLSFFRELLRLLWNATTLRLALLQSAPKITGPEKRCVVVLLSHNRPQNLPVLVQAALKNSFVSKVVVSNSNAKVRIREWITVSDPRLVLVDETGPTLPGHRFVLADREPGEYFISIDDDILLTPRQWTAFFERLLADPEVPHGTTGHIYRPGVVFTNGSEFHHLENVDADVDVLIGAYAFTRTQLERVFRMAEALGIGSLSGVGNGEDILLSFAGTRAPRIHNLGSTFLCASTSLPGVALWTTRQAFWAERVSLLEKVRVTRRALGVRWLDREESTSAQPKLLPTA